MKRTDILRKTVLKKAIKRSSFYSMEEENRGKTGKHGKVGVKRN